MRQTALLGKTLKDAPKGAYTDAQTLLLRSGYLRDVSGVGFVALPLMDRVVGRIAELARGEIEGVGGAAWALPCVVPAATVGEEGMWRRYVVADHARPFESADARGKAVCLRVDSAALSAQVMSREVESYKQLPKITFEIRRLVASTDAKTRMSAPNEFDAIDIHGFTLTDEDTCRVRDALSEALASIVRRSGVDARWIDAAVDASSWTGELFAAHEVGPDEALACDSCKYAARVDAAESRLAGFAQDPDMRPMEKVCAPGLIQTGPLAEHLGIPVWKTTKMLLFLADDAPVAVMVRGDCGVNEAKVRARLGCRRLVLAPAAVVRDLTQAEVGYAGPIGLPEHVTVLADHLTRGRINFECGANETDNHLINVNFGHDLPEPEFGDFKAAKAGEACPACDNGHLVTTPGLTIAHVCNLGTGPAESANWTCRDGQGADGLVTTISAGLHLTRVVAALAEQCAATTTIAWPPSVAPFDVHLIGLNLDAEDVEAEIEGTYARLCGEGLRVLFDDRDVRPGEKFKDSDLLGIPFRLTISRRTMAEGNVEVKRRGNANAELMSLAEAIARAKTVTG